jgi:hypothetical protein
MYDDDYDSNEEMGNDQDVEGPDCDGDEFEALLNSRCFLCLSAQEIIPLELLQALPAATTTITWAYRDLDLKLKVEKIEVCPECAEAHGNDYRVKVIRETVSMSFLITMMSAEETLCMN